MVDFYSLTEIMLLYRTAKMTLYSKLLASPLAFPQAMINAKDCAVLYCYYTDIGKNEMSFIENE